MHTENRRRHWCTEAAMTAWSSLAHSVLMHCLRCMFSTPCYAVFPTHFSQLDLNPANLKATVDAEWILAFLFLRKRHFLMTSQLRHHHVVSHKYWWDILQFFSHTDCQDDSGQKLWKVICWSYHQNTISVFFPDTVYITHHSRAVNNNSYLLTMSGC